MAEEAKRSRRSGRKNKHEGAQFFRVPQEGTGSVLNKLNMEGYRSGHNEAVLKTVWVHAHVGSNPTPSASKKHLRKQVLFATKSAAGGRNPPAVDEIASR